jgi:hypothetical protein
LLTEGATGSKSLAREGLGDSRVEVENRVSSALAVFLRRMVLEQRLSIFLQTCVCVCVFVCVTPADGVLRAKAL